MAQRVRGEASGCQEQSKFSNSVLHLSSLKQYFRMRIVKNLFFFFFADNNIECHCVFLGAGAFRLFQKQSLWSGCIGVLNGSVRGDGHFCHLLQMYA